MKKIALTFGLIFMAVISMNVFSQSANGAQLKIDKEVHDYGTIKKGANGVCYFTITNTGEKPLVISKVKGSCGCTVPEWPSEPIAPGKTAKITVTYDTKNVGMINRSVTIISNAKNTPVKVVRIKGNVVAPAN